MRTSRYLALAVLAALTGLAACSGDDPLSPPTTVRLAVVPAGWGANVGPSAFSIGIDSGAAPQGRMSAFLESRSAAPSGSPQLLQGVRADAYRGQRVRLSGRVRAVGVTGQGGLMMRVDGPRQVLAFDNMLALRPVTGDGDWQEVAVVLDVPAEAIGITFGAILLGVGELRVDDLRLTVVDASVPSTDMWDGPGPEGADLSGAYASAPAQPVNLDFEGR